MQKNATILIPDISGYTEFFSQTDLNFSTSVLCELLNELILLADDEFRVAEIEGDAILFYIKDKRLSISQLVSYCVKAYNHFHGYLSNVIARVEDPEARSAAEKLTLKFIAHWGPIGEINIANFSKPVGLALIKAHKLLKNSINSRAYILVTDEFASDQSIKDCSVCNEHVLEWQQGSEEYEVIGKVAYWYALLEPATAKTEASHTI